MIEIEESVVVSLGRDRVFPFAAHPENMPLWNPVIRESKVEGALEQGAKVVQLVEVLGRRFETEYEVTSYEPFRRVAYTSTSGPVDVRATMEFHPEREGTRVRWVVAGDGRGVFRVAEGILLGVGRPEMRACLENLKRAVEDGDSLEDNLNSDPGHTLHRRASSVISQGTRLLGLVSSLVTPKS